MFCKKGLLRTFLKLTGKHQCQSLFLIKMQAAGKKRLWYRRFSVSFTKFVKASFPIEYLRWLLLNLHSRKENRKRQKKESANKPQEKNACPKFTKISSYKQFLLIPILEKAKEEHCNNLFERNFANLRHVFICCVT